MARINKIEMDKPQLMGKLEIIRFQLSLHCFLNKLVVSDADLNCLTYLSAMGEVPLDRFCKEAAVDQIFKTPQTVRNALRKFGKLGLILTDGKSKKTVRINPLLNIITEDCIYLNLKFIYIEK